MDEVQGTDSEVAVERKRSEPRLCGFPSTLERNAAIVQEYKGGLNSGQIAKKYGISRQRVWQILRRYDVMPHHKLLPSAEELVAIIHSDRVGSIGKLSAMTGVTLSRLTFHLRRHPEWPSHRATMRTYRTQNHREVLREKTRNIYRALVAELGHPANIEEMKSRRIFPATLQRIYGERYVSKFREDMGEVG